MTRYPMTAYLLAAVFLMHSPDTSFADPAAARPPGFLTKLRDGYEMDAADRGRHDTITSTDINKLALNRDIVRGEDGRFTHKIKTKGITDQKASGRCWMFAGFNVMRPKVIPAWYPGAMGVPDGHRSDR